MKILETTEIIKIKTKIIKKKILEIVEILAETNKVVN